jgi:hypothetical protein
VARPGDRPAPPAPNPPIHLPSLKDGLHRYEPHVPDWRPGDPTWKGGKGKGLVGGLNYLASQGVNAVYFLTMNVNGDGRNVWPWTDPAVRDRFDGSKLDQWEIVFSHMTRLGLMLHVVTQETENDHLLDGGDLGPERRLYYRELVARFAHHPAITWNLGEENVQSPAQQRRWRRRSGGSTPTGTTSSSTTTTGTRRTCGRRSTRCSASSRSPGRRSRTSTGATSTRT